ncbi:3-hydroxybutyrate dehydrogenase [Photobacterium angustum]|uniref:3-hydroxybutyrate dehydrogenase n=1 Tax=Photobacterium angustum TaxID=661 RepID=A0A855SHF9_PHOAN|nr:3-hydroxybutyrate dehydrogenase [Photobacterium angustum]KJF81635.1 3-hydroxybutyrate dehydrogenase [Photobacterium damselae subsp. damselae]KJF93673.1 3-hydroxybutyrate dehydrogenase [Photobacterium angustum]KJG06127.1 3-hydroxybutyrate dehydrogenase [Photobacterium angustum]KJG40894.1 3-hydroxybutyrate dehydrogenase [Photobacterium angustum]KJG45281.1 3-hydroxybutyrate dehydrogenase [Photobacterium angustum]
MKLENKVAIITGAASGIGRAIAFEYAKEGAKVIVADLDINAAEETVAEIKNNGSEALAISMNVTNEEQVNNDIQTVIDIFGRIDILVANAGYQHIASVEELTYQQWKDLLSVHLDGAFLTTKACLKHMYKQKSGSIIYMGSVHSKEASKLKAPYVTAKHGLIGLCEVVAKEGAEYNVRANVICPGYVKTPLVEKQIPEQAKELGITEDEVVKNVMLKDTVDGQFSTMKDIAQAAVVFASWETNALTGQSLVVSHGWFMQ